MTAQRKTEHRADKLAVEARESFQLARFYMDRSHEHYSPEKAMHHARLAEKLTGYFVKAVSLDKCA